MFHISTRSAAAATHSSLTLPTPLHAPHRIMPAAASAQMKQRILAEQRLIMLNAETTSNLMPQEPAQQQKLPCHRLLFQHPRLQRRRNPARDMRRAHRRQRPFPFWSASVLIRPLNRREEAASQQEQRLALRLWAACETESTTADEGNISGRGKNLGAWAAELLFER